MQEELTYFQLTPNAQKIAKAVDAEYAYLLQTLEQGKLACDLESLDVVLEQVGLESWSAWTLVDQMIKQDLHVSPANDRDEVDGKFNDAAARVRTNPDWASAAQRVRRVLSTADQYMGVLVLDITESKPTEEEEDFPSAAQAKAELVKALCDASGMGQWQSEQCVRRFESSIQQIAAETLQSLAR